MGRFCRRRAGLGGNAAALYLVVNPTHAGLSGGEIGFVLGSAFLHGHGVPAVLSERSGDHECWLRLATVRHPPKPEESQDQVRPYGGFEGDSDCDAVECEIIHSHTGDITDYRETEPSEFPELPHSTSRHLRRL